jgi:hypothetical protein
MLIKKEFAGYVKRKMSPHATVGVRTGVRNSFLSCGTPWQQVFVNTGQDKQYKAKS